MNAEDVDRMENALRAVVEAAIAQDLESTEVEHAVLWWEPYSDSGSTERKELRKTINYHSVGQMLFADPAMKQLRFVANDVRTDKWPEHAVDPTAENLCFCYFSTVGAVAINDDELRRVAEKYVTEVQSEKFVYVTLLHVAQFSAEEPFRLDDGIEFRPVAKTDIQRFGYEPLPVRQSPRLNTRDWICTVSQTYQADDMTAHLRSRDVWDVLIGSLGLAADGEAWFSLLCEGPKSPFLGNRHYGSRHRLRSSPHGNAVNLDREGIKRYCETFKRLTAVCDTNTKNLVPAFRRFRAAAGREVMDDRLTDLVIGLESLLVPDSSSGEIGYKFRMRGAALLPERFGQVGDRVSLMKKLYRARSEIVHGSNQSDNSDRLWLMHRATDSFRVIFDQLSHGPLSVKARIEELDEAMIGGANPHVGQGE